MTGLVFLFVGFIIAFPIGYLVGIHKNSQIQIGGENSKQIQIR